MAKLWSVLLLWPFFVPNELRVHGTHARRLGKRPDEWYRQPTSEYGSCPWDDDTCCGIGDGRPQLLIIGSVKAGTTALHYNLKNVFPVAIGAQKELFYYNDDANFRENPLGDEAKYAKALGTPGCLTTSEKASRAKYARAPAEASRGGPKLFMDGTPLYLQHPLALSRAAAGAPWAHWIIMVRDPVDRAYSHFNM